MPALSITVSRGPRANPRGHRVALEPNARALCDAMTEMPTSAESWWSVHAWTGDRRQAAAWESACGVMVDLDYSAAGAHSAPLPDAAARLASACRAGAIPATVWHPTPRGARLVLLFAEPCRDAALYERAAVGAGETISRALETAGLTHGGDGYQVDRACLADLSRLMFCPCATVSGVQRSASVEAVGSLYDAQALAASAPAGVERRPRPAAFRARQPKRPRSASLDLRDVFTDEQARQIGQLVRQHDLSASALARALGT